MFRLVLALLFSLLLPAAARAEEIRVWVHENDRGIEAALHLFERLNPGTQVITANYFEGDDAQKLLTAIAGNEPPDVVMQDRFSVGEWAARGALHPLSDYVSKSTIDPKSFYSACWSEAVYQGQVYGVPLSADARALFYNEDLLRKAGFVDAQGKVIPPRDWDELERYAIALTQRDAKGRIQVLGFAPNYGNSWLYIYGFLNGGEFMSADGRHATLNDPRIADALDYMRKLYNDVGGVDAAEAFVTGSTGDEVDPFGTGRVAMKIDGNWRLRSLSEYHPNFRFGVAPAPAPKGKPSVTWSGGFAYVIPSTSKHPDLAFKLIEFMVSQKAWNRWHEVDARYAGSRGLAYIPNMTAQPAVNDWLRKTYVDGNPAIPARVAAAVPIFQNLMPVARFRPVSPVGQLLWDEHIRAMDAAVRSGSPTSVALTESNNKVQHRLDQILNDKGTPISPTALWAVVITFLLALFAAGLAMMYRVRRQYERGEIRAAVFYVMPWVLGFTILTAGPVLMSLLYSFCRYDVLHDPEWVGLANYRRLLTGDPMFWHSLLNTAYMLIGVPLGMLVGLAIALLLNTEVRGVRVYRTLFYLPSIVPMVATSILWLWVLNPTNGLVNSLLLLLGFHDLPLWVASPSWLLGSKASLLLMGLWGAGGSMVIWLAGLKGIPTHLYEAAEIDGAGPIRRFFTVTLPMLSPYIFFNLVMGTIGTMQIFTQAYVMTEGGPADSTMYYAYHLFNSAFRYFEMGYASALAWILMLIVMALTILEMRWSKNWVNYEQV